MDSRQASTGRGAGGGMGDGSACANRRRREAGFSQRRALPSVVRGGACVRGGCEARRGASAGRSGAHRPVLVAHEAGESRSLAGKIARAQVGVRGPAARQLDAAALRDLAGEVRSMATMATGPQVLQAVGAVRRVPLAALLRVRHASRAASTGRRRRSVHSRSPSKRARGGGGKGIRT